MNNTILLGIDGMDPVVTEELMSKGQLPNFELLANQGRYSRLATINPPQSPVVWSTISTGLLPADHGIHDFIHRDPTTYLPYLSLHRQEGGRYCNPVRGKTFWEKLAQEGTPATLLKWPMGFPPRPFDGRLLAGLGVPDIRGMLGNYSLFTTAPERLPSDAKGKITKLVFTNGRSQADIAGPYAASLIGRKEATLPCSIQCVDGLVTLRIGRQTIHLQSGCWSPWVALRFDIGFFRNVTARCRFLLRSIKPEFELYITPLQVDYGSAEMPISTPFAYATELRDGIGDYATLGMAEDTAALNDGALDDSEFIDLCDSIVAERERMLLHELFRFKQGLLACVFDTTDRVQHMFWRMRDPNLHDPTLAVKHGDVIGRYYCWMDRILGIVREQKPSARIIVCSDHGFSSYRRSVHLNNWLEQNGYLVRKPGMSPTGSMAELFDWDHTTAYAVGFNSIYLNLKGRERNGTVLPADTMNLADEISQKLILLQDNLTSAIKRVHIRDDHTGPDLLVGYNEGFRASWQTAVGGFTDGAVIIDDNIKKWSGDHCCDDEFVPGVFFCNHSSMSSVEHVQDIANLIVDEWND